MRSIIPESLVPLSCIVSEKKGGHEKTEIGRISRPEVNFQKRKKIIEFISSYIYPVNLKNIYRDISEKSPGQKWGK